MTTRLYWRFCGNLVAGDRVHQLQGYHRISNIIANTNVYLVLTLYRRKALIILITDTKLWQMESFLEAAKMALEQKIQILLVHDLLCCFPGEELQPTILKNAGIFDRLAVPFHEEFASICWPKLIKKMESKFVVSS
jgi:hypothetical protein